MDWKRELHPGDEVVIDGIVRTILEIVHYDRDDFCVITWIDGTESQVFYSELS
jgi:hypothetical protein